MFNRKGLDCLVPLVVLFGYKNKDFCDMAMFYSNKVIIICAVRNTTGQ